MKWLVAMALAAIALGASCGSPTPERPTKPAVKVDPSKPEDTLHDQLSSGSTQIDGVVGTLDTATAQLKRIDRWKDAEAKHALQEIKDAVDASGAALADFAAIPADRKAIEKRFGAFDEMRIDAIAAANDARHSLIEAQGLADDIARTKGMKALGDIADLLEVAIEDLKDAIESLGGQVEE